MVERLVGNGYIHSPKVIEAMKKVPRHYFTLDWYGRAAYRDTPLDIGEGQTISAPHMVGIMLEALDLREGQEVLEVGGGSGYHAALVAEIVGKGGHVYSVERVKALAERARISLKKAGLQDRVMMITADGSQGWPLKAPYDRIFVACAAPEIPEPLVRQLKDGGKLLIPVGSRYMQELILLEKRGRKRRQKNLGGCVFVPLIGKYGFK